MTDSYEKLLLIDHEESPENLDTNKNYGTSSNSGFFTFTKKVKGDDEKEEIDRQQSKKKEKTPEASFRQLFRYATWLDVLLLILGSLCSAITGAGFPFLSIIFGDMTNTFISAQVSGVDNGTTKTIDPMENSIKVTNSTTLTIPEISMQQYHDQVITYSLQYTYLGLAIMVCAYVQFACWSLCCERQIHRIRREFFKSILRQEIAWFDEHQSGELTTQLSDNLERIKEGIGDKSGLLLQYCFQFISGFIVAFIYSWKLTLVMMSLTPVMALSAAYMSKMIAESTKKEQSMYAVAGARAEEALSSIRTVIAFNGQKQEARKYEEALENARKTGVAKALYTGIGFSSAFFIMFASYGLAFWYGSTLIVSGDISRGTVFVVFFGVMTGSFSLGNAAPMIGVVAVAKGAAASIMAIINNKPLIDSYAKGGKQLPNPKGAIVFEKVSFQYPARNTISVLNEVSFNVEPGENVALVGPSGCGKSTIVNLLLRCYDVKSGKITVDGRDVREFNVRWLRNLIGVVSQEPVLFDLSIEDNIRYGKINATNEQVIEAAKMANAHTFIGELPDGYRTKVGEHGTQLSGGQKQRIAIARALLRDPKILLLDEATSALDSESESVVQEALDKAQLGRTTIVVAHRLSTVRNANKIVVLEKGSIREVGSHSELMQAKGLYFQLVNAQQLDMGDDQGDDQDRDQAGTSQINEEESIIQEAAANESDNLLARRTSSTPRSPTKRYLSMRSDSVVSVESAHSRKLSHQSQGEPRKRLRSLLSTSAAETDADRLRQELKEEHIEKSTLLEILSSNKQEWPYILFGFLGSCIRGIVMPAFAFFYSQIFEAYSKTGQELRDEATFWSIMFVLIGIVLAIGVISSSYCFGVSGEALTMRLRAQVYRNLLRQDVAYFDDPKHSTGRLCTRLATDAPNIKAAVDFRLSTVLSSFISMIAGIVIAFVYGWKLAFLVLALVPIIALGGYLNTKLRHSSQVSDSKLLEKAGKVAAEGIENIRTVQALTREKTFYDNFCQHLKSPHKRALCQTQLHSVSYAFAQCCIFFLYAACFRFGGYLVEIGDTKPLNVFKVFFAITFCGMTVSWATAYFPDFIKARFSAALIFKMIREKAAIDSGSSLGIKPVLNGSVRFNSVYFSYPARPETSVLNGLSLSVKKGQAMALVGPSGCGKSTVVNLLERFYDPSNGQVCVDEYDIRTLNVSYLRQRIALVSQEPVLFNCSIQDNIAYGLESVPFQEVVDAANLANIHQFVLSLPDGYNTKVGEKGVMLSGGQKQRVAIARALVRKPHILILDEATSALDTENEKLVQEALDRARAGRTCIIIAHRLSTIQSSDKIVVIKQGKVVEEGLHAELVNKRGVYFALSKMQNLLQ